MVQLSNLFLVELSSWLLSVTTSISHKHVTTNDLLCKLMPTNKLLDNLYHGF